MGPGLSSFYGEYNENRFEKSGDVISVPSSPEKSPINLDSDGPDTDGSEVLRKWSLSIIHRFNF